MQETIAILYICTWNYSRFWNEFYLTSEKYFLPRYKKHYFVWTDDENIPSTKNITVINQKKLWRPYDTLYRFKFFLSIKNKLKEFDYTVFFNANTKFKKIITPWEFIPKDNENLIWLLHFTYINKENKKIPYERNIISKSYIPYWEWKYYYLWSLNWWRTKNYLDMCEWCHNAIIQDESNNIIPVWHDESMLNKYYLGRKDIKILDPSYWFVESLLTLKRSPKIICLEKTYYVWHKETMRSNWKLKIDILNFIKVKSIFYTRWFIRSILDLFNFKWKNY